MEEIGELAHGINKGKTGEVVDGIGDTVVALTIPAAAAQPCHRDCIDAAWQRSRTKGAMRDGVWIRRATDDDSTPPVLRIVCESTRPRKDGAPPARIAWTVPPRTRRELT